MNAACGMRNSRREAQFRLPALLEYMTVCAILAALSPASGVAASVLLMLMALSLWARQGLFALAMLMAACLAADWPFHSLETSSALGRQLLVILLASLLCGRYCLRRQCT